MKKFAAAVLAFILAFAFCPEALASCVTDAETPFVQSEAVFIRKMGFDYRTAPTPPVCYRGALLTVSGVRLYKLSAGTGEELMGAKLDGRTMYTVVSPAAADNRVFVPLDDGLIQTFDFETFKPLWTYRNPLLGQALCPVVYDGGFIYTGFWNGETDAADYVCLNASTGEEVWTYTLAGGFYRAGACVYGDWLIFGSDDAQRGSAGKSHIIALDKKSGKEVSKLETTGDIRCDTVYSEETGCFYTCSKSGYVYKFRCDKSTGKLSSLVSYTAPGGVTAAPSVFAGRLYTGCQNGMKGKFIVLDAYTLDEVYLADMPGYPQARMTVSTAYYEKSGKAYVYSTYNAKPGGIVLFTDAPGQTSGEMTEIFVPPQDAEQYCISTIAAGPDGTLYYKNDSGCIFAVEGGEKFYAAARGLFARIRDALARVFEKLLYALNSKGGKRL